MNINKMKSFCMPMFINITGYVYFVQMDRIGAIKIGFTKEISQRLISLKTSSPYKLHLLCVFPANEKIEKQLHDCFYDIRLEGEWFLPHPLLLKEIDERIRWNKIDNFIEPNPIVDIRDERLEAQNGV